MNTIYMDGCLIYDYETSKQLEHTKTEMLCLKNTPNYELSHDGIRKYGL